MGLLGDVHAEDLRLEVALAWFRTEVDRVACVGDVVDGLGSDETCVSRLTDVGATVVRGNHERWLLEGGQTPARLSSRSMDTIRAWPTSVPFDTRLGSLLLCHGVGEDDMSLLLPGQPRAEATALIADVGDHALMVCGHTHVRMVRTLARPSHPALTVLNVGTLYRKDRPGFAVLDDETATLQFFEVDTERVHPGAVFHLTGGSKAATA